MRENPIDARIVHAVAVMPIICSAIAPGMTDHSSLKSGRVRPWVAFPHDGPPATVSANNPMGTDGFEFVKYAHPRPEELHALFKLTGYVAGRPAEAKKITVYRQGDINYLVNEAPGTHGHSFVAAHGPCAPSMAFRVVDAKQAYARAVSFSARSPQYFISAEEPRCPRDKRHRRQPAVLVDRYGEGLGL